MVTTKQASIRKQHKKQINGQCKTCLTCVYARYCKPKNIGVKVLAEIKKIEIWGDLLDRE